MLSRLPGSHGLPLPSDRADRRARPRHELVPPPRRRRAARRHFEPIAAEKAMIRLGDVVSREGRITEAAAEVAIATVRRFRLLAEAAGATELARLRDERDPARPPTATTIVDRIEAETGVTVEVISGRREAELIFGAIRAARRARAGARAVLRPRRRQRRDHGRRRRRPAATRASENARRRAAHRRVRAQRPDLEGRPARLRAHLARGARARRRRRSPRSSRSSSSGAAARSRTSRTWSRRGASADVPDLAQPADVHPRRVPPAAQADPRRRRPTSGSASTASRRGASTSSRPARCSSRPRWSSSASTR